MSQQQDQVHLVKMTLLLKKVSLTVRFPCSISFALKNEQQVVQHRNIHELKKGQCLINQSIQMELELIKTNGIYEDKKVSLMIFIVSVNGKIPAGSVAIVACDKVLTDRKSPLEKCPDKNAEVTFTQNCQFLHILRKILPPPKLSITISPTHGSYQLSRSRMQYSASSSNIARSQVFDEVKTSPRIEFRPEGKLCSSKNQNSSKDLRSSQGEESQRGGRRGILKIQDMGKNCLSGNIDRSSSKASRTSSQFFVDSNEDTSTRKSRMSMLQSSKANYLQTMGRFRHSVARVDSEEQIQFDDDIEKMNLDSVQFQSQTSALRDRERIKTQQKRQRDASSQMRDIRDELNQRRSRIVQLDNSRIQTESQFAEKDKLISQIQLEKKNLQQQLDEEKSAVLSSQRRLQMKQNSYKDQLKKINQKYAVSESERQKSVFEYNNLLASIETNELKSQYVLRQKERVMGEQKMKLSRKVQQLAGQLTTAYEKIAEWKIMINELQVKQKKYIDSNHESETKVIKLIQENKALMYEIKLSEDNNRRLVDERERADSSVSEDRITFKRKYNDALGEVSQYRDRYDRTVKSLHSYQTKIVDLEAKLDKSQRDRQVLNGKLDEYRRKEQTRQKDQDNRDKMTETLSIQNNSHSQKLSDLRHRMQTERKRHEDLQQRYEEKMTFLVTEKQMLEGEVDELKWRLQKEIQKFQTMNARNRQLSEQTIELSQKVIVFEEKQISNDESLNTKNYEIKELSNEVSQLDYKMNYIREHMKDKDEGFFELQKMAEGYCKDIQHLKRQNYTHIQTIAQKDEALRKAEGKHRNDMRDKEEAMLNLTSELDIKKEIIAKLRVDLDQKNKDLTSAKQQYRTLTNNYSQMMSKSENRLENHEMDDKIEQLQALIRAKQNINADIERELDRKISQFQGYKTNTTNALQQMFSVLNRQEIQLKKESILLMTLPDQKLAILQMETVKNHNNLINKLQQEVNVLKNSVEYLQIEMARQEEYMENLQEEHSFDIKREQERNKMQAVDHFQQVCALNQKIQAMNSSSDGRTSEADTLGKQVRRYESILQDHNETIKKQGDEIKELKGSLYDLDKELFGYKQKEIKDKMYQNTEIDEVKELLLLEQERVKMQMEAHRQELKHKDKIIAEKSEEIKKMLMREEEFKLQKVRLKEELRRIDLKEEEFNRKVQELDRQVKEKQRIIRKLEEEVSSGKLKKDEIKLRYIEFDQEIKKHRSQSQHLTQQYHKFKEDYEEKMQELCQQQIKEREKRQKIEVVKQRMEDELRQLRQKCVRLQGELQFYIFYKVQTTKKLQQHQHNKQQTMSELIRWRESASKSQKQISHFQNKYYKYQVQIQSLNKDKAIVLQQNSMLKQKLSQLDQTISSYESTLSQFDANQKQIIRLNNIIKNYDRQTQKITAQLKNNLIETKQALFEKSNKVRELQKFVEDKYNDLGLEKLRWQKQSENEKTELEIKIAQFQDKYQSINQQYQFQKLQAIRQVESANGIIQELNEVIRQKQDYLSYKDDIINQQEVRLQQLTIQLSECINKWQTQKESFMPTEAKMAQISEQIARMNKFINDLDGRNKQLLEINKRRMQQKVDSKTSLTQLLKQICVLMQKNKNKILSRCQSEKEKEGVIKEFRAVQEKLDMTLKSTQVVAVKR